MLIILPSAKSYAENCQTQLNSCIKMEQECYDNYTKAVTQLKETEKINGDLVKALNQQKKEVSIEKLKLGLAIGSSFLAAGLVIGLVAGVFVGGR